MRNKINLLNDKYIKRKTNTELRRLTFAVLVALISMMVILWQLSLPKDIKAASSSASASSSSSSSGGNEAHSSVTGSGSAKASAYSSDHPPAHSKSGTDFTERQQGKWKDDKGEWHTKDPKDRKTYGERVYQDQERYGKVNKNNCRSGEKWQDKKGKWHNCKPKKKKKDKHKKQKNKGGKKHEKSNSS